MSKVRVFLSYSHKDEWLKDELLNHCGAMRRGELIEVWHDRMIPPGGLLNEQIDDAVRSSDLFLFLVSPDFINSNYCMETEYRIAKERFSKGEVSIVPVIIRQCDWDVMGLQAFNALPKDAIAVTKTSASRNEPHERDGAWLDVVRGIKTAVEEIKKKLTPPTLAEQYICDLFTVDFVKHKNLQRFDERKCWVEPDVYFENRKETISSLEKLVARVESSVASILAGKDRSGKTLLCKMLHVRLDEREKPNLLIDGKDIKNADLAAIVSHAIRSQYGPTEFAPSRFGLIIDNFDSCTLPDRVKEDLIRQGCRYRFLLISSYSTAPAVLFASDELPDPSLFNLNPLADAKLYGLVLNWKKAGTDLDPQEDDVLSTFERLQQVFAHGDIEKSPYSAVTFLQLLDNLGGSDLAISSFAACYDAIITNRLLDAGVNARNIDEVKNFLSLVAYSIYGDSFGGVVPPELLEKCLGIFEEQFLSSRDELRKVATDLFLKKNASGYIFREEYLWYFLCARYAATTLKSSGSAFTSFVDTCTKNIFQKKYANIVIYLAYFNEENDVLRSLLNMMDGLFSKADDWLLSDKSRTLMLDIEASGPLSVSSTANVHDHRIEMLKEKIVDIVGDAEKVVARYTLPFLDSDIQDSKYLEELEAESFDAETYLGSVNALLRTHSVVGHILNARTGTFTAGVLLECISKMVQASGRYAHLNHAIATLLIFDRASVNKALAEPGDTEVAIEERYHKVKRIFAFWSVYLAQAGLARYLSSDHCVRALQRLVGQHEAQDSSKESPTPFNYTSVLLIAKLYQTGNLPKAEIEKALHQYGQHSALFALLRAAVQVYSYYMPISFQDKQWVSKKVGMPIRRLEMASRKGLSKRRRS